MKTKQYNRAEKALVMFKSWLAYKTIMASFKYRTEHC